MSTNILRDLRAQAHMTQAQLAALAGTSQPTIAAYEAGRKSPTLRTLNRLARATGRDVVISFVPAMTREDRRSLFLHRAIAEKLLRSPSTVIDHAGRNLHKMMELHSGAFALLDEWAQILQRPVDEIIEVMSDPRLHARDLRQVTPFAGVLSAAERASLYEAFARSEREA